MDQSSFMDVVAVVASAHRFSFLVSRLVEELFFPWAFTKHVRKLSAVAGKMLPRSVDPVEFVCAARGVTTFFLNTSRRGALVSRLSLARGKLSVGLSRTTTRRTVALNSRFISVLRRNDDVLTTSRWRKFHYTMPNDASDRSFVRIFYVARINGHANKTFPYWRVSIFRLTRVNVQLKSSPLHDFIYVK